MNTLAPPDRAEELRLIRRAKKGDVGARNELVERHYPFIYRQCLRFANAGDFYQADDLVGEAVIWYCRAIEKFRFKFKCRLNTFAGWYLRKAFQLYHYENRSIIRVPQYAVAEGREQAAAALGVFVTTSLPSPVVDAVLPIEEVPAEPTIDRESLERLAHAVRMLDGRRQFVLRGRAAGRTYRELSAKLGISRQRVEQLLADSVGQLRVAVAA